MYWAYLGVVLSALLGVIIVPLGVHIRRIVGQTGLLITMLFF